MRPTWLVPRRRAQRLSASLRWARPDPRTSHAAGACAQRLSASLRWARDAIGSCASTVIGCSTPFGITEAGTRARRCITSPVPGAQRLSASLRWAPVAAALDSAVHGAQRLSASLRGASADGIRPRSLDVCSTPFGITEVGTLPASAQPGIGDRMCSTPFGITEAGTSPSTSTRALERPACSTPFGITEAGTVGGSARHRLGMRCSTPFGITEAARAVRRSSSACSACAQRLSASLRWARRRGRRRRVGELRCSTPFGITEAGTAGPRASARSVRFVCSTPFGITEAGTYPNAGACQSGTCAQRLSASLRRASAHRAEADQPGQRVLNAFRHH